MAKTKSQLPATIEDLPDKVREAFKPLTPQERKFVEFYCDLAKGSATQAIVLCGLCRKTETYPARASKASRLNRDPRIRAAKEAWMETFGISPTEIKHRLADLTQISPHPFYRVEETVVAPAVGAPPGPIVKTGKGRLKLKELTHEEWDRYAHWVKAISTDEDGNVTRLEMHDSYKPLQDLAKINGLYSDAPIFTFNLFAQKIPDEELLRQIEEARREEQHPFSQPPIAVIAAPKA